MHSSSDSSPEPFEEPRLERPSLTELKDRKIGEEPFRTYFDSYVDHGTHHIIEGLPEGLRNNLNSHELKEAIHLVVTHFYNSPDEKPITVRKFLLEKIFPALRNIRGEDLLKINQLYQDMVWAIGSKCLELAGEENLAHKFLSRLGRSRAQELLGES